MNLLTGRTIGRRGGFHDDGQSATVDQVVVVVVVDDGGGSRWMLELIQEGRLEVANVVDDVVDDFHLGDFAILGHVGHQLAQFAQVHLDLHLLVIGRMLANFAVQDGSAGWRR